MRFFVLAVTFVLVCGSLLAAELVPFTIKTEPDGVLVSIDGKQYGRTVQYLLGDFLAPGTYSLHLQKEGCLPVEASITIREDSDNFFVYVLPSNMGAIYVYAQPEDVIITINGDDYSDYNHGRTISLEAGQYRVTASKPGWEPSSEVVDLPRGEARTVRLALQQHMGGFKFVVQPLSAQVTLSQNGQVVSQWTGNKLEQNMPAGEYDVSVTAHGFKSETGMVQVREGEMEDIRVTLEPGRDFVDFASPSGFEMVAVKGAKLPMGYGDDANSGHMMHYVILSDYFIGKYEVTQSQYYKIMGESVSKHTDMGTDAPVENVTWFDAIEFCNRLSVREELTPCYTIDDSTTPPTVSCDFDANGYRLPTDAEWEMAARGGVETEGYRYSGSNSLYSVAWYYRDSLDDWGSNPDPRPVGQKRPNELGIYDMTGNVWEWCWDWYWKWYPQECAKQGVVTDPSGDEDWALSPDPSRSRVIRGGSIELYDDDEDFYVFARRACNPFKKSAFADYIGFRIATSAR